MGTNRREDLSSNQISFGTSPCIYAYMGNQLVLGEV